MASIHEGEAPGDDDGFCRVLVVHSHPEFAEHMAQALRFARHEATVALTYADALEAASTSSPHAVIVDIGEASGAGIDLGESLRARLPESLLLAVVDRGKSSTGDALRRAGFNRIIGKPLEIIDVVSLIDRWHAGGRCLDTAGDCDS